MKIGSQENVFVIRQSHMNDWKKDGLDDKCYSCKDKMKLGMLCHTKLIGEHYQRRHAICAIKFGVLRISILEYKMFAAGLREEKTFFVNALLNEAKKVQKDLQEQVKADYPYLKVKIEVAPPRGLQIPLPHR